MNVFLDDIRHGPHYEHDSNSDWVDWVIVRSIDNARILLKLGVVNNMSLDHDLGGSETGYDLCKWMAEHDCWPQGNIEVHSANPVGATNMRSFIERYKPVK